MAFAKPHITRREIRAISTPRVTNLIYIENLARNDNKLWKKDKKQARGLQEMFLLVVKVSVACATETEIWDNWLKK